MEAVMAWNKIGNFAALSMALIFAACGGDSGSNGKSDTEELAQAETFDDLPNCSKNREGETQTVVSERKTYQCIDGRWEEYGDIPDSVKNEDDLPACLEKYEGKIAFVSKDTTAWGCFDSRWENLGKAYQRADDLPNCSEKRDGSVAYIMNEGKQLFCSDGKWSSKKTDSPDQGGESKSEVKSSSSNKTSSSSVAEKETTKSSSSEAKNTSSEKSSSSVQNTPSSSSIQSSDSADPKVSYGSLTDERDGQKYKTVKIGDQIWMAENLNYDYKIDGKRYGSYCYDDEPDSCAVYGRLYTWATAMDSAGLFSDDGKGCGNDKLCNVARAQGVCPENWHLPSRGEWELLFTTIRGTETNELKPRMDGVFFKSKEKWKENGVGTDDYGFSILPSGGFYTEGSKADLNYRGEGGISFYWTVNESSDTYAEAVQAEDSVFLYSKFKKNAYSVRCIKNISKKATLNLDLSKGGNVHDAIIPAETNVYATMPKCGKVYNGNFGCFAQDISYFEMKIGDIDFNGDMNYSKEIMDRYCGEEKVLITTTARVSCNIVQGN